MHEETSTIKKIQIGYFEASVIEIVSFSHSFSQLQIEDRTYATPRLK
jgi:hypothetical protein